AFPEGEVVLVGPALITVSFDEDEHVLVRLQPGGIGIEHLRVGRSNVVFVEVEEDVFQVGDGRKVTRNRAGATAGAHGRRRRRGSARAGLHGGGAGAGGCARTCRRPGRPRGARRCWCRCAIVAGRFGQPTLATTRPRRGTTPSTAPRAKMMPTC